jgi:DNA repair photolyase
MKITTANKGRILTKTGFYEYDYCLNPYVGCRYGCAYCYVRFFIKDETEHWGQFLRTRDHLTTKLPRELKALPLVMRKKGVIKFQGPALKDARIVLGTMTDPYQPEEKKLNLTRQALQILLKNRPKKVGLFTRSPLAYRDADLFQKLDAIIHVTVSPLPQDIKRKLEPIPVTMKAGLRLVEKLKQAGIRTFVSIAPAIPQYSEQYTQHLADEMARLKVDEFFLDPMQPYGPALEKVEECLKGDPCAAPAIKIMSNKDLHEAWKKQLHDSWMKAWDQSKSPNTRAVACDHEKGTWKDMATGEDIPY